MNFSLIRTRVIQIPRTSALENSPIRLESVTAAKGNVNKITATTGIFCAERVCRKVEKIPARIQISFPSRHCDCANGRKCDWTSESISADALSRSVFVGDPPITSRILACRCAIILVNSWVED